MKFLTRWMISLLTIVGLFLLAAGTIPDRAERFWMLLPPCVLFAAYFTRVIAPPKLPRQTKWKRYLTLSILISFPFTFYLFLTAICRSPVSFSEMFLVAYFFIFSLECLLLYFFNAVDGIQQVLERKWPRIPKWLLTISVRVPAYVILIPTLLAIFAIHRPKLIPPDFDFADASMIEEVSFPSREPNPLTIRGDLIRHRDARGTVIVCHGVGANRGDIAPIVEQIYDCRLNVLAFDFRGHGESDGHTITYGGREVNDILGAYDFLLRRPDIDSEHLYAYGVSMGGSSLLLALPQMPKIQGAVVDSAFADLNQMVHHQLRLSPEFLRHPMVAVADGVGWMLTSIRLTQIRPTAAVTQIDCPLGIIHGQADRIVPISHGRLIAENSKGSSQSYFPEDIGHLGTALLQPYQFRKMICETFALESD